MAASKKSKRKTPLIKKHGTMVMALAQAAPTFRKKVLEQVPPDFVKCVSECCHNVLKGNVPLSDSQKRRLHPQRRLLRLFADKKISTIKKKKVLNQHGGFLPLLGLLAPAIAPILGSVVKGIVKAV